MLSWRDPMNPKSGGAERVSQAYMMALRKRGHEVQWFANAYSGSRSQDVVEGIQIIRGGGQGSSVYRAWQWYRRQPRFDLVIDQHHGIPWYAPWWSGTNTIAYIHEVLGPIWDAFYRWPWNVIGRRQETWTHWFYRNVPFWTPSESTRKSLMAAGVREVKVIPNGVDTIPLASLEPKPLKGPIECVVVCRLAPNKRVDHAIASIEVLLRRGVDVRLTVVGTGEQEAELKKSAATPEFGNRVRFLGHVTEEEKNKELARAHLLIHTSMREGWGLNVIEANAMGTPAVVYPVGGLVDSTVDGQTGMVTRSEYPEEVANTIQKLAAEPQTYERLRHAAWERSKEFVWDRVLPMACEWLENQARTPRR
jgi:glycosyltransferase involved in cell wall biosynthesis